LRRHAAGIYGQSLNLGEKLEVSNGQYTWLTLTSKIAERIKQYGPTLSTSPYTQRSKCTELRQKFQLQVAKAKMNLSSFSLDLVKGMYRQLDFVNKICVNFQYWNDEAILTASIARYFKFMNLMKSYGKRMMLVPTMDIDLVWHTHQTHASDYYTCCWSYFKHLIDHDDTIPSCDLHVAYTHTFISWSRAYHEAYSSHPPDYNAWRRNYGCFNGLYREMLWRRHSSVERPVKETPVAVAVPVREGAAPLVCVLATPVYDSSFRPDNNLTTNVVEVAAAEYYVDDSTGQRMPYHGCGGGGCGLTGCAGVGGGCGGGCGGGGGRGRGGGGC